MKRTVLITLASFLFLALCHLILWPVNSEIYLKIKAQELARKDVKELKDVRTGLEEDQRKELESYEWLDQRKEYAKIPIDRAFDYYLHKP